MQPKKIVWLILGVLLLMLPAVALAQDDVPNSISPVHRFSDFVEIQDTWSTLSRYENGVMATLHTRELSPDDVVTMWWVIFNEPASCSEACDLDDIYIFEDGEMVIGESGPALNLAQIEAAQIAVLGATGSVISNDGEGHFSAVLMTGDSPNIVFRPSDERAAQAASSDAGVLQDPLKAEIHLVLRTHGPINPDALDEQILTFNGGCAAEWPNEPCQDVQFAVHQPQ